MDKFLGRMGANATQGCSLTVFDNISLGQGDNEAPVSDYGCHHGATVLPPVQTWAKGEIVETTFFNVFICKQQQLTTFFDVFLEKIVASDYFQCFFEMQPS